MEGTKNNKVFIVVWYNDIIGGEKLSFFTETGNIVDSENKFNKTKGYVLLATIQAEPILHKYNDVLTRDDILTANKYLRNQTQSSKKDYHFSTTGHIYDFGYGPVYTSNIETKHTVNKFAKSKYFLLWSFMKHLLCYWC